MFGVLDEMKKRAEDSKVLWSQIDELVTNLKQQELTENENMLLQIMMLIAQQVRPLGSEEEIAEVSKDINDMMSNLMNQLNKGKK